MKLKHLIKLYPQFENMEIDAIGLNGNNENIDITLRSNADKFWIPKMIYDINKIEQRRKDDFR